MKKFCEFCEAADGPYVTALNQIQAQVYRVLPPSDHVADETYRARNDVLEYIERLKRGSAGLSV